MATSFAETIALEQARQAADKAELDRIVAEQKLYAERREATEADRAAVATKTKRLGQLNQARAATGLLFTIDDATLLTKLTGEITEGTLKEFALANPPCVDGRSAGAKELRTSSGEVRSRADVGVDTASKVAFIAKNGLSAWEQLPASRPNNVNNDPQTMTAREYLGMARMDRMAFQQRADVDEKVLSEILRRK